MENVWTLASVGGGLARIAMLLAIWFKISMALSAIVVGTIAQLVIGAFFVHGRMRLSNCGMGTSAAFAI